MKSGCLDALMGREVARFRDGWPLAQEPLCARSGAALAELLTGLPKDLAGLGRAWVASDGTARCLFPRQTAAPELLSAPDWNAVLERRKRGASVQLLSCEGAFTGLAEFIGKLRSELGLGDETETTAGIFTAGAGAGFPRHRDSKDVWIIGLAGQKTVWTAPAASVGPDHRDSIDESPLPMPANAAMHTLGRGDVLYIPRGCWHQTRSETEGTFSLSIGLTRPWRAEVLAAELVEVLSRDARWRRPMVTRDERIPAELVAELASWLAQRDWWSGSALSDVDEGYLRNRDSTLAVVDGKLQVQTCGETTTLRVSSNVDLAALVTFVEGRARVTVEEVGQRFPALEPRVCVGLLELLFQGGLLRRAGPAPSVRQSKMKFPSIT